MSKKRIPASNKTLGKNTTTTDTVENTTTTDDTLDVVNKKLGFDDFIGTCEGLGKMQSTSPTDFLCILKGVDVLDSVLFEFNVTGLGIIIRKGLSAVVSANLASTSVTDDDYNAKSLLEVIALKDGFKSHKSRSVTGSKGKKSKIVFADCESDFLLYINKVMKSDKHKNAIIAMLKDDVDITIATLKKSANKSVNLLALGLESVIIEHTQKVALAVAKTQADVLAVFDDVAVADVDDTVIINADANAVANAVAGTDESKQAVE